MNEALQSTCAAKKISSYFVDKVRGTKRFLGAQEGHQAGNKTQES